MNYASFGSVSSGTMRDEDLLDAFSMELDYQMKRQPRSFQRKALRSLVFQAQRLINQGKCDTEEAGDVVQELFDALDQFSPAYGYFGAHEGDGADYGYWLSSNVAEEFDGLKVDDLSEVPAGYRGEVMHVNDHGNVSLYVANGRGKFKEIWAVV